MKANKTKGSKKAEKKISKQESKTLEASVSDKVLALIKSLGYDADKLGKGIKKASRKLVAKITIRVEKLKAKAQAEEKAKVPIKQEATPVALTLPKRRVSKRMTVRKAATALGTEKAPAKGAYQRKAAAKGAEMPEAKAITASPAKRAYKRRTATEPVQGETAKPVAGKRVAAKSKTTGARRGRKPKVAPPAIGAQNEEVNLSTNAT